MRQVLCRCRTAGAGSYRRSWPSTAARQATRHQHHRSVPTAAANDRLWIETTNQGVLTAAVESGYSRLLFQPGNSTLASKWHQLAAFEPLLLKQDGTIVDASENKVGRLLLVSSSEDLKAAEAAAQQEGYLVMDATDWKIIPAENLVAAFQSSPGKLMGVATTAADARVMLEALETGTAGVLLRTEDPLQVKQLAAYITQRDAEGAPAFCYELATVTKVLPVGMCDRVCVDLCSLLQPGEGMLVGSFARALFLVHSECMESQYINSRPFRVNAGAVHAYVQAPNGRTAYLSELKSGAEVLVADAAGRAKTAVVGRCKIETRPMMLVEAETADGLSHSTLLQNAETVRLIGPSTGRSTSSTASNVTSSRSRTSASPAAKASAATAAGLGAAGTGAVASQDKSWQAVSVSELKAGQQVFLLRQDGARHTGISIQERINEK